MYTRRSRRMVAFWLATVLLGLAAVLIVFNQGLAEPLRTAAEAKARSVATEWINQVVKQQVLQGVRYDDLIRVTLDREGRVAMMEANSARIQELSARAVQILESRLQEANSIQFRLPVGFLLGSDVWAQYGPTLPARAWFVGDVLTRVRSEFTSAGINQTKHSILLDIVVNMRLVVPLLSHDVTVTQAVPVAEVVIVGEVPNWMTHWDWERMNGN